MCKNRAELPGFSMITKLKVASGGIRVQPEGDHRQHTRAQGIHICAHDEGRVATLAWKGLLCGSV